MTYSPWLYSRQLHDDAVMDFSQNLHDPKAAFGDRLRQLRTLAGMSQEELAHRAGLDRTYVSSCERGKRNLTLEAIVAFAAALDVKASELLVGVDHPGDAP